MRAYERLLDYVKVYTTSDPESGTHPSAAREFDLAHKLVEELKALGVEDARVDEHCYVYGSLPATPGCEEKPALGLIAHMDTAPDASGENVNPEELEKLLGRETAAHIVRNGDELFHDQELDAATLHQPKKFLGMWV